MIRTTERRRAVAPSPWRARWATLWALALLAGAWTPPTVADGSVDELAGVFDHSPLVIIASGACLRFIAYEAATPGQLSRGLMHVREMPQRTGMLFRFPPDSQPRMWMRNTYIPLDMLFIDANGVVVHVAADAVPHSLTTISTDLPSRYVLEINGGVAAELGIEAGARLLHRWLP